MGEELRRLKDDLPIILCIGKISLIFGVVVSALFVLGLSDSNGAVENPRLQVGAHATCVDAYVTSPVGSATTLRTQRELVVYGIVKKLKKKGAVLQISKPPVMLVSHDVGTGWKLHQTVWNQTPYKVGQDYDCFPRHREEKAELMLTTFDVTISNGMK